MLTNGDYLSFIKQQCHGETKNLDFKSSFDWSLASAKEKAGIVKDILAMANTENGGRIIIGITNDYKLTGLDEKSSKSFDQTDFNNYCYKYCDPEFASRVIKVQDDATGQYFVVIDVPEFKEVPIVCKKNLDDNGKNILREGAIYVRTDKAESTTITNSEEMRDFITRAAKRNSQFLIEKITLILKGSDQKPEADLLKIYAKEIKESNQLIRSRIKDDPLYKQEELYKTIILNEIDNFGTFSFQLMPQTNKKDVFKRDLDIKEFLLKTSIHLKGWHFPCVFKDLRPDNESFNTEYYGMSIVFRDIVESYILYKSGFLNWLRILKEDMPGNKDSNFYKGILIEYLVACFIDFFEFTKSYIESLDEVERVTINITYSKMKGRELKSPSRDMFPFTPCIANEIVIERDIGREDLGDVDELIWEALMDFCRYFNTGGFNLSGILNDIIKKCRKDP